ncbi:response regulator [Paenibacillus tritici]|uniref:hybrid sensor histidine kinase/response regulator n=1 Tax=Paenibacillus tritici TaxID=1873425 RepID=UPI001BA771DE|nr:response regulator [Paenibacillus tritici]
MKLKYIFLLLGLLIAVLSGSRILWMEMFGDLQQDSIKNGELHLRDWNAEDGQIVLLDGEWEFYSSQWLSDGNKQQGLVWSEPRIIQVPGGWNEALHAGTSTPYGFGSYRLRLYVNPEQDLNYSIHVPSIRTSSEVYVNGRLLAKSGRVADSEEDSIAKNLPYSTTFTADKDGVIELVIQASNFVDSRNGGIVRSIKFGSEEAITKEMKVSVSMQILTTVIFLIHSAYAFILFLLGNKQKKLLYFSLLTFFITLSSGLSSDEKLFHQIFYIGNVWDFRLSNVAFLIGAYALLECTNHRELAFWHRMYPVFRAMILGTAGITLFLDTYQVTRIFPVYYLLGGIAGVISTIAICRTVAKDMRGNLLLFFSILALIHHFIWMLLWREGGYSVVYYPFDLIISMGCLASVWFRNYFNMYENTNELATALQRMNDHKDQFLVNTSHEFKNPLHSILNLSQSVLKREQHLMQERSIKELDTIFSVGRRLTLILNDLIDVMSLREGNPRIFKKVILIQPIVTGVLDMLQLNAEVKSVKITNQIPEDFPLVHADENRIIQIVFNLLHNAVKYTNDGVISISAYVKDGRAYIVIADTGIGMDEYMLKCLFRPYEQANTSETMIEGGFGLGLSISKQLVELHGGTLDVTSTKGEGSQFIFSLKLAGLEAEAESAMTNAFELLPVHSVATQEHVPMNTDKANILSAETPATFFNMDSDRPVLLIIDDDPVNLQVLEAILPPDEYDITMVTSAKQALAILDTKEWDLVISDIMMPMMSGYELTRRIRERFTFTELPVLLLTARSQPQDIQSGFLAGANDYVTKPVEAIELKLRIKALTTIKQSIREQLRLEAVWLQAQIQPHFLFNALNAISALSDINLEKMRDLLEEFTNYLRNKFKFQNVDSLVPVEEELSLVRSYLYIEQVRFEDRLQVIWEIDDYVGIKVPFLSIQPLVENAIRHGIMKRKRGGSIVIRISVVETHAEITVEDDGGGMDEVQLQRLLERNKDSSSGVGLINTDQRLKRHFGTGLDIKSSLDTGTTVTFHVPVSREKARE